MVKRIAVLDSGKEWGGGINSLFELMRRIDRRSWDCTVILYQDLAKGNDSTLSRELAAIGIPTVILPSLEPSVSFKIMKHASKAVSFFSRTIRKRLLFDVERRFRIMPRSEQIAVALREIGADLLYMNNQPSSNLEGSLAAEHVRIPVIQHCRKVTTLNPFEREVANRALSRMICVSEGLADAYVAQGVDAGRCAVVPNGIDLTPASLTDPATVRQELGVGAGACLVGTVASFLPVKRLADFVRAAAEVVTRRGQDVVFLMVGDGPERSSLENLASRLGVGDRLAFAGFRSDALSVINAMDIFVLTSEREGMPRVVLEAMLMGKPVVGTRVTGTMELVVDGESGFLVPVGEPKRVADALELLAADPALRSRQGACGRQRVMEQYSIEAYVSGVERVFREVLG